MAKLTIAFRSFANGSKNVVRQCHLINISVVEEAEVACSVGRWQCMFLFNDIRLQELVVPKRDKSIAAPKILMSQQGKPLIF